MNLQKIKKFLRSHSLSIFFGVGFVVTSSLSLFVEYGTWEADWWLSWAAGFGILFLQTIANIHLYEKDSDPLKPKKKKPK